MGRTKLETKSPILGISRSLYYPNGLLERVDARAKESGLKRNQYILRLILKDLNK